MAWRNLWRHKRRTWLTVGAMVFSNLLLVFMISLQFGSYRMMIDNSLKSYTGHMQIQREGYNDEPKMRSSIDAIIPLATKVREQLGSDTVAARGVAFAMTSSEERSYGLQLVGVEPAFEPKVSTLPGLIKQGSYFTDINAAEIVIGTILARNLRVGIGDELTLLGSGHDGSFAAGIVDVVGIFGSGIAEIDRNMAQLPIGYFQNLFGMGDKGHNIVINAAELSEVTVLQHAVMGMLAGDDKLVVLDWEILQPGLKQAIQADFASAWFMYAVLIVLVAFSVLNTQLMSVLERTREFGVMMALGVKPARLGGLVITETFVMSGLGLVMGIASGLLLTGYFSQAGFTYPGMEEMADRFNLPDRMYPSISLLSTLLGPVVVFLFSLLASLYPALRLFFLQPVAAMRAV
ncbi:MAG: FtsX-like permease family protein [Gammaproteobacteria bacterium]|jgi:ABC-type lipoprotein release transport system permease subunit